MSAEKNGDSKKRKSGDRRWSPDEHNKEAKSPNQRVPIPPLSKYNNFTDLNRSCEDVFLATEHTGVYKRPDSLWGDFLKRNQNNTIGTIRMSTTPQRSALYSRTRLKNSFEKDISEITFATEALSRVATRVRQDLLARSGPSSVGHTSSGRREEPKTTMSEKQGKD